MKRFLKFAGFSLAGLLGVVVVGAVIAYALSMRHLNKVYSFNDPPLAIPSDSASVAASAKRCVRGFTQMEGC